jgi:hypothetical protein
MKKKSKKKLFLKNRQKSVAATNNNNRKKFSIKEALTDGNEGGWGSMPFKRTREENEREIMINFFSSSSPSF